MRALPVIRLSSRETLKVRGALQFQKTIQMNNNTLIIQAVRESEVTCACVGVPLKPAEIRSALNDLLFDFTEEKGMFKSKEGVEWSAGDFQPDWTLVSE